MIYINVILLVAFHAQMIMRITDTNKSPMVFFDMAMVMTNGCLIISKIVNE